MTDLHTLNRHSLLLKRSSGRAPKQPLVEPLGGLHDAVPLRLEVADFRLALQKSSGERGTPQRRANVQGERTHQHYLGHD
jgi:hypothetical protein